MGYSITMLRQVKDLEGFKLETRNGSIGKFSTIHFDDESWNLRYIVADIGNFLKQDRVLLLPTSIYDISFTDEIISVNLSKEDVEKSPHFDDDPPVSKQYDFLVQKYQKTSYIVEPWSGSVYPILLPDPKQKMDLEEEIGDKHLYCCKVVSSYSAIAKDKRDGHVEDFIFDDKTWQITHVLLDINDWMPGGKRIISVDHIDHIDSISKEIVFKLSAQEIENISQKYEDFLFI